MSKLEHIVLKGYKSVCELDLQLTSLNVLIGANGSGKSNFLSLFRLLNEMVLGNFENYIRRTGGSESYLYHGEKITNQIFLKLEFDQNGYEVCWQPTVKEQLIFFSEKSSYSNKFRNYNKPYEEPLSGNGFESGLLNKSRLSKIDKYVLDNLLGWKVYHFHDTSESAKVKKAGYINSNESLDMDGGNLAAFLFSLKNAHPISYEKIRDAVRQVAPFFDDFNLRADANNSENILLEWKQQGSSYPYRAYHLSDGTLRFICLATVLLQPKLPSTIVIDEPELGLHPYAISVLGGLIRSASKKTQLIISTQSVELVNEFSPEDILIVDRNDQDTQIKRLDKNEVIHWLDDYSLGEIWKKNIFGGII